ncbi:MAG: hypothetical protein JWR24_1822 [Actinoallomurus sp.]|jgi:hypothetical protein|nr:hypothetical protein [Actinoallomurus sp.]
MDRPALGVLKTEVACLSTGTDIASGAYAIRR